MLGAVAARAAYDEGVEWLDDVLAQFEHNRDLLASSIAERLPDLRWKVPEATYLAWLDFSAYGLTGAPADFLAREAKVITTPGSSCGEGFADHVRFNFALPPDMLAETIARIEQSIGRLG